MKAWIWPNSIRMIVQGLNSLLRRLPVWVVYLAGLMPAPMLLYLGATGGLGVEPIEALEHELGRLALQFLICALAITPLRRFLGLNLLRFRRAIALLAFTYVTLHLLTWLFLDVQVLSLIWADIIKRPYITIGMAAFLMMLPLAATSNNWSVRKLGPTWRKLHKLTYAIVLFAGVHFVMVAKGFQIEPLVYLGSIIVLLLLRLPIRRRPAKASSQQQRSTDGTMRA